MSESTRDSPTVQRSAYHRLTDAEEGALEEGAGGMSESKLEVENAEPKSPTLALQPLVGRPSLTDRFLRRGKRKIRVTNSLKAIVFSSWLNILLLAIPFSWVFHFMADSEEEGHHSWAMPAFFLSFVALIPLAKLLEYGGDQMTFYLGPDLGDLLVVTLNNSVEATLAIILLKKCELKLLQSSVIGVVLLRLLLVPGVAFVTGGSHLLEQDLHPALTELNHTLLTVGVFCLLLPAAFFSAMNRGGVAQTAAQVAREVSATSESFINDTNRGNILAISRGLSVILLAVYVVSRIFLHKPPGEGTANFREHALAPEALRERALEFENEDPELNQWVCIGFVVVTFLALAATAEWLVDSVDVVEDLFTKEWFGLILLPLVSFSGDAFNAILYFIRATYRSLRGQSAPPNTLANARPIDLSIQFIMFWMPFIILLGWWTDRPISLLFDSFEVALLISSCFIVNYVTADAKTNYAEGFAMLAYWLIALTAWFYTGQSEINSFLACGSVAEAVVAAAAGGGER
ncbi:hypothetical protein FB45DRAFT_910386 [Roridomyces roridus]|uniref:Sodium/calcium exchanger membrane region domain-containing protein n=1 Tax=Roridomyces roridus TaxID=1738132 RepID=A0AAD7FSG1_9AGAR|nr:hypothetical protein FB45DRAFT_910386 [Roridomyces roridus]